MADWTPNGEGAAFEFTRILKPLEPFREDTAGPLGPRAPERRRARRRPGRPRPRRRRRTSPACTRARRRAPTSRTASRSTRSPRSTSATADAPRVARARAARTRARSATATPATSCAYTNSLSWRGPTTPMPPETNPRLVFERLFGADRHQPRPGGARAGACAPPEHPRPGRARARRSSSRDLGPVGPPQARRVPARRSARSSGRSSGPRRTSRDLAPDASTSRPACPSLYADYVKLMFDLQVVAFQADLTRVVTMMMGREGSLRTYPEIGVPDPHHPLTHHRGNPEWIEKVTKINAFHVELFADFIGKLKATPDGDGIAARPLDDRLRQRPQRRQPAHPRRPAGAPRRAAAAAASKPGRHVVYPKRHADDEPVPDAARPHGRAGRRRSATAPGKIEHLTL